MKYLFSLWSDEKAMGARSPQELQQAVSRYDAFTREVRDAGVFVSGEGLDPTPTSRTLRLRAGARDVTDGPFAETKEQLGGFYVLECRDLDEAISWASKIPAAEHGSVEVRPVMEYQRSGDGAAEVSS